MKDKKRHDRAELYYFVDLCLIIFALFSVSTCSTEEKELPNRQFFEEHFLENLPLGSNESQFKDYGLVYNGLEDILGKPSKKSSKRISGALGPTVSKNKTAIWKLSDFSIKLQSKPGGGSISLMQFYTNAYPLRLKEPFEKQIKDPAVSLYNRKHYETWINAIETDY